MQPQTLLACRVEGLVLTLDGQAAELLRIWEAEIESMLREGREMETMRDWGAKLAGATLRLAAILHCIEDQSLNRIRSQTLSSAIQIARALVPHAELVLNLMQANEDSSQSDAQYLVRWIKRHKLETFTKTEAQHHGERRFPKSTDIDPALDVLERHNFIRSLPAVKSSRGRPRSPGFAVNPVIHDQQHCEPRSQYSQNSNDHHTTENIGNNRNGSLPSENEIRVRRSI